MPSSPGAVQLSSIPEPLTGAIARSSTPAGGVVSGGGGLVELSSLHAGKKRRKMESECHLGFIAEPSGAPRPGATERACEIRGGSSARLRRLPMAAPSISESSNEATIIVK
jgi:hypothetical protein